MYNNMPTTRTPLEIDPRFVVEAQANDVGCYMYSLYVGTQYVYCLGIDGVLQSDDSFTRYTKKQAIADATEFAAPVLARIAQGKPYKNGDNGLATKFLKNA